MGLFDKIKSNVEMWKIERYTKRRNVNSPDFEQKDKEFYRQNYKDGVYLHQSPDNSIRTNNNFISSLSRKTTLLKATKTEKILRSSENYNRSAR
ncbi:uncharacterized protein BX663DRAFT_550602 [Cokeromyces recurvatus]|uniref:uncharacterized protein n=1 Tax=Cokeromyces recurvatus TaxID=90255 RepID=UPI00221FAE52|nr:uncharacterized protein BX663DRAFT_550602 [Cokeromyces recurvatus]KAI7904208.1 hypothetical protein BX663DRAFT_550602 [Cokeromyces recurvatus]